MTAARRPIAWLRRRRTCEHRDYPALRGDGLFQQSLVLVGEGAQALRQQLRRTSRSERGGEGGDGLLLAGSMEAARGRSSAASAAFSSANVSAR